MIKDTISGIQILMLRIILRYSLFYFVISFFANISAAAQTSPIIGVVEVEQIIEDDPLFGIHAERYKPDEQAVEFLTTYTDTTEIYVFFGNWCRESKKYLPGLVKTLRMANAPNIKTTYIGVDEQKKLPELFLYMYDIRYIPSVVVIKGNEEIGRIIEAPRSLIELHLVEILKKGN